MGGRTPGSESQFATQPDLSCFIFFPSPAPPSKGSDISSSVGFLRLGTGRALEAPQSQDVAEASLQSLGCGDGCCHHLIRLDHVTHLAITWGRVVASAYSSPM